MKGSKALLATFLGSFVGVLLCFAFYRVTGTSMTVFSSASLLRQVADLVCVTAFATFGITMLSWLFARISR
jgi:hypothetical protein